ncbi:DUF6461 domain-containing protein [Streptomyces sp. NPDC048717]|uniref:DUF6461 domain-containing protein n=1 Tax=Streptomyces sp. NPDC048717 TaxID=3154928 RepID=UPI00344A7231
MTDDGMQWIPDAFETYCLMLVRELTVPELVRRLGADPAGVKPGVTGPEAFSLAMNEGPVSLLGTSRGWAFSLEHWSDQGAEADVLAEVSRGTEAVVLVNSGIGMTRFLHAVDGLVVADFEPGVPATDVDFSRAERPAPFAGDADFFEADGSPVLGEAGEELWMLRFAERVFELSLPRAELEHGALAAVLLP